METRTFPFNIAIVSYTLLLWPIIINVGPLVIRKLEAWRHNWYVAHSLVKIMSLSYAPSSTSTRTW